MSEEISGCFAGCGRRAGTENRTKSGHDLRECLLADTDTDVSQPGHRHALLCLLEFGVIVILARSSSDCAKGVSVLAGIQIGIGLADRSVHLGANFTVALGSLV